MKRKQSTVILSAAMAAMMLMSGCGKDGGSAQQETATKNADGKYEPTLTITIANSWTRTQEDMVMERTSTITR